jgi:hypothetical protein
MHRFQVSLPHWQQQFLSARARRDGVSVAEVIRVLIAREAQSAAGSATTESFLELAGIGEDRLPLIGGLAVSERPEAYLTADPHGASTRKRRRSRVRRRTRT